MNDDGRVIETIKRVMPAVVSIMITKNLHDLEKEVGHQIYPFLPGEHPKKEKKFSIPGLVIDPRGMVQVGGGSGFIVDQNGLVITDKHVISDPKAEYSVILNDGRKCSAVLLSLDPINDIAILKIGVMDLPIVPLGDATKIELGQSVIAIGNALGIFKNTVSLGIVSGLSRAITARENPHAPSQELRGLIQTDAAINPGNSGGPLVNLDGEAVGVNAAIVSGAQNIGFAIPINAAKRDLQDLQKYGRIRRPLLGVRYLVLDDNLKEKMGLSVNYGAYLIPEGTRDPAVVAESPADKAGLREKDIILECNGKRVTAEHPIQDYLDEMNVGDVMELVVMRGTKQFRAKVALAERK